MLEQLVILAAGLLVWLLVDPDLRRWRRARQRARRIAERRATRLAVVVPVEIRERERLVALEQQATDNISWSIANGRETVHAYDGRDEIRRRIRDLDAHVAARNPPTS